MKNYIKLLRPKHWVKNLLIYIPAFFGRSVKNIDDILKLLIAFLIISLVSSSIYIINDIKDIESDRKHPRKCKRPLASGAVSIKQGIGLSIFLILLSLSLVYLIKLEILAIFYISVYFGINCLYSIFGFKNIALVDVVILAFGFVLRVLFGSAVIDLEVSNWLYLVIMMGAFYLGLGKRRNEYRNTNEGIITRKVLKNYSYAFLDKFMYLSLNSTMIFYSLWCSEYGDKSKLLIWTVPLLYIIMMKYSLDIEKEDEEGDPVTMIMKDKTLIVLGMVLAVVLFFIIYL